MTWAGVLKGYADLLRIHFFFAWPLLFCSGMALAFSVYGGFSWPLLLRGALIGFLGFEAGFVLNDLVDRHLDRLDVDRSLTRYWRPFGTRPLAGGSVGVGNALLLFLLLVVSAAALALTLPYPNSLYLILAGLYSYGIEAFYQIKKRSQSFPVAQLLGRTDFALFPAAGYLACGRPDTLALGYMLFFYPFAMAHLGMNDLADLENDLARGMKTVPVLYGRSGTVRWIASFLLLHTFAGALFLTRLGPVPAAAWATGSILLWFAAWGVWRDPAPAVALRRLPFFHITMLVYSVSILLGTLVPL